MKIDHINPIKNNTNTIPTNIWNGKSFEDCLQELTDNGVFEIWSPAISSDDAAQIFIPYMMNDAMECYFILKNATLIGHFDRALMSQTSVSYEKNAADSRNLLIIRQEAENTCTIWFHTVEIKQNLYRFDEICHFWKSGNEQWSQMVYMIGTMYDKFLFNGGNVCNPTEQSIMHLIEFAPFRAFAPAPDLFEELYDNTWEGLETMTRLAKEAKDYRYFILCKLYGTLSFGFWGQLLGRMLMNGLTKQRRYPLYQLIFRKATRGASSYPSRHYLSSAENERIATMRSDTHSKMLLAGFIGAYPNYHRDSDFIYVRITEEQPFTIMDWEEITFSQSFMVSYCKGSKKGFNRGFFCGNGLAYNVMSHKEFFERFHA